MRTISGHHLARALGDWSRADASGPAYVRLASAVRMLIFDGRLPLEARLPGERELATALGVSRTTVTAAYDLLRDSGYARSRQGSGTRTTLPETGGTDPAGGYFAPFAPDGSAVVDLAHAAPEAPLQALNEAHAAATEQLPRFLTSSGYNVFGLPELRRAVADRFTARGLPTTPEQIFIASGAQHAFSMVLSLLVHPGDRVLIDHPTYPNAIDAIHRAAARAVPVALTDDGWDIEAFAASVRQTAPNLAYLVPDFNNPTGHLADDDVRRALAIPLRRGRTLTVVDETLAELPLGPADGEPPAPFATYVDNGLTITIGTMSKTLWGGLRVGWIRAEASIIRRLAAVRASFDISSPVLNQLIAVELLKRADDVLATRREDIRTRRDALMAAMGQALPEWRARTPCGGLVLWYDIGAPVSTRLVTEVERYGIRLAAGPRFGIDGAFERRLRLPYSLPVETLRHAVPIIARAYAAVADSTGHVTDGLGDLVA
ncbi:MocR-like transcription factor YczR [Phytoactinopolyspora halotolerans]|uniref:PLP-dependent aminotransferase family protein n=1 Tax=Phytoactinopolyspora halotolerans TaxID=1981512 RepID=A0A6L9S5L6_9ACTN|nr:PLP-dependent aminotransferase family protein [Phytoactinopolyspora halotolerans]NED99791.1 PLP-dependent aminotransferase family protein [Phytoactinopolyspora halotolerans]